MSFEFQFNYLLASTKDQQCNPFYSLFTLKLVDHFDSMPLLPFIGTKLKLLFLVLFVLSISISKFIANNIHRPKITLDNISELDDSLISWEKKGFYVKIYVSFVLCMIVILVQGTSLLDK